MENIFNKNFRKKRENPKQIFLILNVVICSNFQKYRTIIIVFMYFTKWISTIIETLWKN